MLSRKAPCSYETPVKATRYHILLALAEGTIHGAEIQRRVDSESGGAVKLYPAMLYRALDDLERDGWIEEVVQADSNPEQVRWRFYSLTPEGHRALEAETARLETVLDRARAALEAAEGT